MRSGGRAMLVAVRRLEEAMWRRRCAGDASDDREDHRADLGSRTWNAARNVREHQLAAAFI